MVNHLAKTYGSIIRCQKTRSSPVSKGNGKPCSKIAIL